MITLDKIRKDMKKLLDVDESLRYVDVLADTLDEALADAAVQLDTRVSLLEYEVIERGSKGFLGFVKKNWKIRAYEVTSSVTKKKKSNSDDIFDDDDLENVEVIQDKDGVFYVRHFASQLHLKVILPVGKGEEVNIKDVLGQLNRSDTVKIDESTVKNAVKSGTNNEYIVVGQYQHNPAGDALLTVEISSDEMHGTITVSSPAIGGADISADQIRRALQTQGVVAGISEEKINEFVDSPVYGVPFEVASAELPVDGKNAYISYNFETDKSKLKMKESASGQVDFKELNRIQNVVEGQPLAQKMEPERGKAGKTILGRYLEAKNGKDINLPLGKNVYVDTDGKTICASINGQVVLNGDKISVEPVYLVEGDVSIKTGNITFLGTVIVKGCVDDGYEIKASGNIEIAGTVGRCKLEADGNIIVNQGIMGRDEGYIRAGKSLWAKFIQNTKVDVEEYVYVSDSIMNSDVTCNKKVFVQGKRAAIVGGHIFATEEIYTKNIGSAGGGSETILEVGYDPRAKNRLDELQERQSVLLRELDELDLDIKHLEEQKKVRRTLPHDKEEMLINFTARKKEIVSESDEMSKEIQEIQEHLKELKVIGKISASGTVYAGVKIYVRDVKEEIRTDVKQVTFYYENGFVRHGKYESPSPEDAKRVPDGYTAD